MADTGSPPSKVPSGAPAQEPEWQVTKRLGNDAFTAQHYSQCIDYYSKSIQQAKGVASPQDLSILHSNLSASHLAIADASCKSLVTAAASPPTSQFSLSSYSPATGIDALSAFMAAQTNANEALKLNSKNVKAAFRKSQSSEGVARAWAEIVNLYMGGIETCSSMHSMPAIIALTAQKPCELAREFLRDAGLVCSQEYSVIAY